MSAVLILATPPPFLNTTWDHNAEMTELTFDKSNDDHNEPTMVVMVVGMMDTRSDLANSDYLFHRHKNQFDRQKADTLVKKVQWAIED